MSVSKIPFKEIPDHSIKMCWTIQIILWLSLQSILSSVALGSTTIDFDAGISGKIVDAETKEPIEMVNVYLSHTLLGSTTSNEGLYVIEGISTGVYDLVVSRIGYTTIKQQIEVTSSTTQLEYNFELVAEVYELESIGVTAEQPKRWQKQFDLFHKLLLGTMPFEEDAEILNPYGVDFREDRSGLTAHSDDLLVIENHALGYRIYLQLMGFEWRKREDILLFSGTGYFEYITPPDEGTRLMWHQNRSSRGGNYSWLARSNPSGEGAWKARIIQGRCTCNEYNYGIERVGACRCSYRGLSAPQILH